MTPDLDALEREVNEAVRYFSARLWNVAMGKVVRDLGEAECAMNTEIARLIARLRTAEAALAGARAKLEGWQDIASAPLDQDVHLGWWAEWPTREWKQEIAWAGASNTKPPGFSNAWSHGSATHWRPLPAPPQNPQETPDV